MKMTLRNYSFSPPCCEFSGTQADRELVFFERNPGRLKPFTGANVGRYQLKATHPTLTIL